MVDLRPLYSTIHKFSFTSLKQPIRLLTFFLFSCLIARPSANLPTYPRYQSCLAEAPLVMLTTRPQTLIALSEVLPLSFLKRQKTTEQGFNLSVAGGQTLGNLSNEDGDGNENENKTNRFRLAKQQLCTCITLFCTFLCRRCKNTT